MRLSRKAGARARTGRTFRRVLVMVGVKSTHKRRQKGRFRQTVRMVWDLIWSVMPGG